MVAEPFLKSKLRYHKKNPFPNQEKELKNKGFTTRLRQSQQSSYGTILVKIPEFRWKLAIDNSIYVLPAAKRTEKG